MAKAKNSYEAVFWPIIILGIVVLVMFPPELSATNVWAFLAFLLMALVAEAVPTVLPNGKATISVGFAIVLSGTILFGPGAGAWLASIGSLSLDQLRGKHPLVFVLYNRAQLALSGVTAGLCFKLAGGTTGKFSIGTEWFAVLAAAAGYLVVNAMFVMVAVSAAYRMPIHEVWVRQRRTLISSSYLVLIPLAVLVAMVHTTVGTAGVVLFSLPLLLARFALQRSISNERMLVQTTNALVRAIEARDEYTSGHSERVKEYAVRTAKEMHLSEDQVTMIEYLSSLHDIGKISIRDEILRKPGPLTKEEFADIRTHPVMGATILQSIDAIGKNVSMVTHHHERYDGKGYPDGLAGEDIPLGARIIGVCDAYDAMTSHRPYRPTMTPAEALREVQRCSGTQFDPVVVKAFLRVMDPLNVGRQRD